MKLRKFTCLLGFASLPLTSFQALSETPDQNEAPAPVYTWIEDNGYNSGLYGGCVEVSHANAARGYRNFVPSHLCKPEQTQLVWHIPFGDPLSGDCLEVGPSYPFGYKSTKDKSECKPEETTYIWRQIPAILLEKYWCVEIDTQTGGYQYSVELDDPTPCRPEETEFIWSHHADAAGGSCYEVDAIPRYNRYKVLVAPEHCKPEKTEIVFRLDGHRPYGVCLEVDSETKGEHYQALLFQFHCKPEEITHIWFPSESDLERECLVVDAETGGSLYREQVLDTKCKEGIFPGMLRLSDRLIRSRSDKD